MSRIPASSSTARTPPPAITPVPSLAGRSNTRAASERPRISCVLDGLRDCQRDLAGLAIADADTIDLVADDDQCGEREPPSTLDDLGDAVDLDHALFELAALLALDHLALDGCELGPGAH
jgi:hypothetical protein